MILFIIVTR